jgi:para-aminobenzoate synthetase component I
MATRLVEAPGCVRPLLTPFLPLVHPLDALSRVERDPNVLFLDSGGSLGDGAGWTILAFDPAWRLQLRDGVLWRIAGEEAGPIAGDPVEALAHLWPSRFAYEWPSELIRDNPWLLPPFVSGLAGFVSYDFKDHLERYPQHARRESRVPDLSLAFYDVVWAWSPSGIGVVVSSGLPERDADAREQRAEARLRQQWERILGPGTAADAPRPPKRSAEPRITSNFTRGAYCRVVERALEHIAAGDIYQVNLAQQFRVEPAPDAPALYRSLREASPAPFASFLTTEEAAIVSSSPERFFEVRGDRIETWPIKGTRPRGETEEEDRAYASALAVSSKDRAENVMIVDLERNDLGRICDVGSVHVPALCEVERYANVHHLVSRVAGTLREDAGPTEILRAMFPGGSITGAPKIRAVEIIDELEPTRRGAYTGAIGYWDVSGDCDFNIAIRTIVVEGGAATFHVGGGIVADSTPEGEYEETLVKARGMMRALGASWVG